MGARGILRGEVLYNNSNYTTTFDMRRLPGSLAAWQPDETGTGKS